MPSAAPAACSSSKTVGSSVEPLMPIDYAIGVGTFVPNNAVIIHEDAVALMAEARRRAWEQYGVELEHEVVFLGDLELPSLPT